MFASLPVYGRRYAVEKHRKKVAVRSADSKKLTDDARKFVENEYKLLGEPAPLGEFLDGKTLKVGVALDVPAEISRKLYREGEETTFEVTNITLKERKNIDGVECAVFDLRARFSGSDSPGNTHTMDISGTYTCQTDTGWPVSLSIIGTITGHDISGEPNTTISGEGKIAMTAASKYPEK